MLRVESLKLLNGKKVSFEMKRGESFFIRGKNGCGKSLFLKALANLMEADYQTFQFEFKNINEWEPETYRSEVLYVSAYPHLIKNMKVREFFEYPLKLKVYKDHAAIFDFSEFITSCGIKAETLISDLSTGQKQILSLLRALTLKPKILLLDEPTANLDPDMTNKMEEIILEWQKKTNGSLVWVTHSEAQERKLGFKKISFEELEQL